MLVERAPRAIFPVTIAVVFLLVVFRAAAVDSGLFDSEQIAFEHVSVGDGLSQNTVEAILQDDRGFLWIGTMLDLNRLCRHTWSFSHFRHTPGDMRSLSNPAVRDIHEDSRGALWIATGRGGLNLFDRQNEDFTRYGHDPDNDATLSSDRLTGIAEDPRGFLWIGTENAGVNRFDPQTGAVLRFRHVPGDPESLSDDAVTALLVDREETL